MAQVTAHVHGKVVAGKSTFEQPFRLGYAAKVHVTYSFTGWTRNLLFVHINYASGGHIRTAAGAKIWEQGTVGQNKSGSVDLNLAPGDYIIHVDADDGQDATITVDVPPPPSPQPPPPGGGGTTGTGATSGAGAVPKGVWIGAAVIAGLLVVLAVVPRRRRSRR